MRMQNECMSYVSDAVSGSRFGWGGEGTVVIGMHSQENPAVNQRTVGLDEIIPYEGYDGSIYDKDIMLLKLSESVDFMDSIEPVCLPEANTRVEVGTHCYTTGWGALECKSSVNCVYCMLIVGFLMSEGKYLWNSSVNKCR